MTNLPLDNARFRTLEDGTVLYRRNRSTRTYVITSDQRDQISKLHQNETAAAFLLAPPILGFVITSLEGDFGLVWQITGVYTLIYCVFNLVFSRRVFSKIDTICQSAKPAAHEQEIEFSGFLVGLKSITTPLTDTTRIVFFVFFLFNAIVSFFVFLSVFFDVSFMNLPDSHWVAKLIFGVFGMLLCGTLAFSALQHILEMRASKKNV